MKLARHLTLAPLVLSTLGSLAPDLRAQCLLDRALHSQPTPTSTFQSFQSSAASLSGDWLAYGKKSPDEATYVVDFLERESSGLWELRQSLALPSSPFTGHAVGLDGEHALIASGSELQSYRLDAQTGQWQAQGAPFDTFWSISEFDYDHPYAIVANPSYDISAIFLNGQGRILEVLPDGNLSPVAGFSGSVLDQYAGDGVAVAGDLVAYGAPGYDGFGKSDPGFVRTYRIDPFAFGGLQFLGELSDPNPTQYSDFGSELAMSADYLAVRSANGSSSGGPEEGERIVMHRFDAGTWTLDGVIQLPQGWSSIGDSMGITGNSLAVTVRNFQSTQVLLYQRLLGSWVPRTSFDEPEGVNPSAFAISADAQRVVTVAEDLDGPGDAGAAAWIWDFSGFECQGLVTSPRELSVSEGGQVDWLTSLAPQFGGDVYLVLGSSSGTQPGLPLGALTVPLNFDDWSLFTLNSINQGILQNTLGLLDSLGGAASRLDAPGGNDPALVGAILHQASLSFDPLTGEPTGVSVASPLTLVP